MKDTISAIEMLQNQSADKYKRINRIESGQTMTLVKLGYDPEGNPTGNGIVGEMKEMKDDLKVIKKQYEKIKIWSRMLVFVLIVEPGVLFYLFQKWFEAQ